jgi:hypothetical protein
VLNVRLAPRYLEAREDQEERVEASAVHHFPFAFGPSSTVLSMAPEYAADNPVEVLRIYRTNGKTFHPPGW